MKRLADTIDALVEKDNQSQESLRRVELRRAVGALELHTIFGDFVAKVNSLAKRANLVLDPEYFDESMFLDSDQNFFQIHVRGRILLVTFGPPFESVSKGGVSQENYREPYILEGAVRCFNQELLESESIEEHQVFYCSGSSANGWRFLKPHTYQTGIIDESYLASVFESLL